MDDNPGDPVYHNPYNDHPPSTHPSPAYTTQPVVLPKVGQTRCCTCRVYLLSIIYQYFSPFLDWALLTSDLQFIYLDPVLNYHLGEQAELLVGKSLLAFVHPDEQASAKRDLGNALESNSLLGSVTRCVSSLYLDCRSFTSICLSFTLVVFVIHGYLLFGGSSAMKVQVQTG